MEKEIRKGFPYPPSGSNYSADLYKVQPPWESSGASDHPTIAQWIKTTDSTATTRIKLIEDGYTYTMVTASDHNTWTGSNAGNMWQWNPSAKPTLTGTTNPYVVIFGHKGPASNDSVVQSWQRGVVGFSMEHKDTPYSGMYGHYLKDCTLLYRNPSDSSMFYGVDLLYNGNSLANCVKSYANQTPFKTNSPRRDGSQGGFYVAMNSSHPSHDKVINDKYIFQGLYMLWETYDGNSQFRGKLELWNMRLIFQTNRVSDDGKRICHPKMWRFDDAWTSNSLKLTYT